MLIKRIEPTEIPLAPSKEAADESYASARSASNKFISWSGVDLFGSSLLLDLSLVQDSDPIRQRQGFRLIMGYIAVERIEARAELTQVRRQAWRVLIKAFLVAVPMIILALALPQW